MRKFILIGVIAALSLATAGLFSPLSAHAQRPGPRAYRPGAGRFHDHPGGHRGHSFHISDWVWHEHYGWIYVEGWASDDGTDVYRGGRSHFRPTTPPGRRPFNPRPFHPEFGSSMRPSKPFA